jgi:hypothetical protein
MYSLSNLIASIQQKPANNIIDPIHVLISWGRGH